MSGSQEVRGVKGTLEDALSALPVGLRAEALTHVSYSNERGPAYPSNERLEFLGDAVLYLSAAHLLFERFPGTPEGDLTRMRASVVSGSNLASVALAAGLGDHLRLGRGEEASGGRMRPRLLASALEAVVGAVYLSGGWTPASDLVDALLMGSFAGGDGRPPLAVPVDPKTIVQERVQKAPGTSLEYRVLKVEGPDHSPVYTVACVVGGAQVSTGRGPSKKEAEEDAAAALLRRDPLGG
jgi:ribonuclease-3